MSGRFPRTCAKRSPRVSAAPGMTVRDYAAKIGMGEDTPKHRVYAARVVSHVGWSAAFDGPPG